VSTRRPLGERLQRLAGLGVDRAGQLELDQSQVREQREVVRVGRKLCPVEAALDEMDFALTVTVRSCARADRVARFGNQQGSAPVTR
jgi:hypothetical protein